MNPLNAKAKSKEIATLLDEYVPGVEELMTKLKKTSLAAKEMRGEIADLKKEVGRSYSAARIQERILKLLEADFRKCQRAQERLGAGMNMVIRGERR